MPSNSLMRLTETQENYSAGASQIVSTTDLTRSLLNSLCELRSATGPTNIAWSREWPGAITGGYVIIGAPGTEGAQQIQATTVIKRFACNVIVSQLPEEAMPELYETLFEMFEHYIRPITLPAVSASIKLKAKQGKTNPPPEIRIEE